MLSGEFGFIDEILLCPLIVDLRETDSQHVNV